MASIDCVGFIKNCISDGIVQTGTQRNCTLQDLATWQQIESEADCSSSEMVAEMWTPSHQDLKTAPHLTKTISNLHYSLTEFIAYDLLLQPTTLQVSLTLKHLSETQYYLNSSLNPPSTPLKSRGTNQIFLISQKCPHFQVKYMFWASMFIMSIMYVQSHVHTLVSTHKLCFFFCNSN